MIETKISSGDLGWTVRKIRGVNAFSVTLNDGVCFGLLHFPNAKVGDIWAVKYEPSFHAFGQIAEAILLEAAKSQEDELDEYIENLARPLNFNPIVNDVCKAIANDLKNILKK